MIKLHDIEEQTDSLASYLPTGRLFESAWIGDSNFRKLLTGFAGELFNAEGLIKQYQDEYAPDTTTNFIAEWENALGIPDDCFSGSGTITERRRDVMIKLASLGVQTEADYIALADLLGVTIEVIAGAEIGTFPYIFPLIFFENERHARFTLVIRYTVQEASRFPLTFPFIFGDSTIALLECIFRKVTPSNVNLLFDAN